MKSTPGYSRLIEIQTEIDEWRSKHEGEGKRRQNPFTAFADKMKKSLAEYSPVGKVESSTGR